MTRGLPSAEGGSKPKQGGRSAPPRMGGMRTGATKSFSLSAQEALAEKNCPIGQKEGGESSERIKDLSEFQKRNFFADLRKESLERRQREKGRRKLSGEKEEKKNDRESVLPHRCGRLLAIASRKEKRPAFSKSRKGH